MSIPDADRIYVEQFRASAKAFADQVVELLWQESEPMQGIILSQVAQELDLRNAAARHRWADDWGTRQDQLRAEREAKEPAVLRAQASGSRVPVRRVDDSVPAQSVATGLPGHQDLRSNGVQP